MRNVGAVVVGIVAVAVLTGWGTPLMAPRGQEDQAAARAVRALTGTGPERAIAAVPPDFAAVAGYRPVIISHAGRRLATRGDGGCSSPLGATPFDFSAVCARHDLGYDLLRYAARRVEPLGGWARQAIDDQFAAGLAARCRDQPATACADTAALYTAVVRLNTWRQGGGPPLTEDGKRWVAALAAGICMGLGVAGRRVRALDPAGAVVALLATVLSLGPSLLPLGPVVQGLVSGVAAVHGYALGVLVRAVGGRHNARSGAAPVEVPVASSWAGGALVLAGLLSAVAARSPVPGVALDLSAPRWADAGVTVASAGAVLVGAVALARGVWRAALRVRGLYGAVRALGDRGLAVLAVLVLAAAGLLVPAASAATPDRVILGREGLRFVASGPDARGIAAATGGTARDPLRVYVGMGSAPTNSERVELAVTELERGGGFARSAVLVVVPTGSGWVNPAAVESLEYLAGGDLATVAVQYAARPSWQEYIKGGVEAEDSATALVGALRARLAAAGPHRPRLLVYGESLGAMAALPAVATADAALLTGMPGAAWDPTTTPPRATAARTLLHPDDPVGWWSPRLLVQRPAGWSGQWLPIVSFWQVTGSLLGAVTAPAGHGHRYGGELVDAWRSMGCGAALSPDRLAAVHAAVDPALPTPVPRS